MKFYYLYDFFSAEIWARFFRTPEKIADELKRFPHHQSVLEIGTAEAYNLRELVKNGVVSSASGYDISERRLQRAKQRIEREGLSGKIALYSGDGEHLPFNDGQFDVVLLPQVLEHIPSRRGVIDLLVKCRRIGHEGLIVSLPLRDSKSLVIRLAKYIDPDHLRGLIQYRNGWIYDSNQVEQLFREIGFKVERSETNDEFYRLR